MAFLFLNLYDTPGLDPRMNVLFWWPGDFPISYSNRDTGSFMVDTGILFSNIKSPLTNVTRHSDPWPTVTSQPIRLPTNFMTLILRLTFTKLWVVSMWHLQRVWHANRERSPFRTPGSVPRFGTCLCSNCWDQIPQTCHDFTRLFTLNTPWYFLDFAYYQDPTRQWEVMAQTRIFGLWPWRYDLGLRSWHTLWSWSTIKTLSNRTRG